MLGTESNRSRRRSGNQGCAAGVVDPDWGGESCNMGDSHVNGVLTRDVGGSQRTRGREEPEPESSFAHWEWSVGDDAVGLGWPG